MKRALLLLFFVLLLAGCARADFNAPGDVGAIEKALAGQGLQVCEQGALAWTLLPGFVEGKYYDLATDCTGYDANRPGARVVVAAFANASARDAALRNFEGGRRLQSPAMSWSKGPLIVVVDGPQSPQVAAAVRQAMAAAGAQ